MLYDRCSVHTSGGVARRLTQPFVTWSLLVAEFSELAAEVASKYFTELPSGRYAFRPAYNRSDLKIFQIDFI